jgi:hypothetical protein
LEMRRLEDRIRELCTRAIDTAEHAQFNEVIEEIREALHEHANRLRKLAATKIPEPERHKPS